ncbi:hypothetical protein CHLRE_09g405200v5 [Chlamydomonas reinhardtii]|uniref:Uncharacterized protein n=1 Tax=Chlamydomonas reinhardtii TaxID=3055 RepID=A8J810_CHLRE|nr:uncharacterized protein CHLRE_09g405200v5 [Chlamydomonas reinhardtii]PNW79182.1 hypothetical protein CHLRE_09g405200v5 [Chlamydomonas reinhardtii]7PKT_i Chain i, Mitochondrial ribosomal protein L13 [Chlamydomonas reinhardtii]|eukprot:XP_001697603.1 mitochondrial ribosomal protein L13 [Chlamydomonas reinhardtii]
MSRVTEAIKHLKDLQHIKLEGLRFRIIDAKGQVVGRLAEQISVILQGKDKPTYNPTKEQGDVVIVVNASHVELTHDKWNTKLYRWHTGYPGGLRSRPAGDQWEKDPRMLLRNAVSGMLPKNKSREARMEKLKIFPEADHPFQGFPLVPYVPPPRRLQDRGLGWPLPQGFEPANLERYAFRLRTSPALQAAAAPTVPASSALAAAPQPSAPVTGPGPAASAPAAAAAAAGTAGASGSGSGRQQRQRPTVPIDDLLTEEERAALAAVEGGKGKSGASSS